MVGAGAIGLGIAWRAARSGLSVTVADPEPGRGASWMAAGMLAPVTEVHYGEESLLRLNLASHQLIPRFVQELEADAQRSVGYRACGTVLVARDNDDNAALNELFAFQQRLGLDVRRLRSSEVRAIEPALATSVRGGILVEGDHQIDNRALIQGLLEACRRLGVGTVPRGVTEVVVSDGSVGGVRLDDGSEIAADRVVVAAGAHSGAIGGIPPLPVRPVKGQLLHLRSRSGQSLLTRNVRGLDVYLVPRSDGRLVVGATVEEQGFDPAVTAGAVRDLLEAAYELVPGITELELVETAVGHRPGSPDNAPLIGAVSGAEGLFVATGHYRNGILLLPVTSRGVAALLTGEDPPDDISGFGPGRFDSMERVS